MGFFDFLKQKKNIDPWGEIKHEHQGYSCKSNFSSMKNPVQITFLAGARTPSTEDRNAFKILEETYPDLAPKISAALLEFWKEYKSEHEPRPA